jgi:hypothetical protein
MNATYQINALDVAVFNKLVANAQKKATKLGVEPVSVVISEPFLVEVQFRTLGGLVTRFVSKVTVTISGGTPKFAGWKLVGVVSPLQTDDGTLLPVVTAVPGETVVDAGMARDPLYCDHCKVRRDRLESFLVAHEDGRQRQVGRNCLADFLGDERMSPAGLAGLMNTLRALYSPPENETSKGVRQFDAESFDLVLACAIAAIRTRGWVSSKQAYFNSNLTSTKSIVSNTLPAYLGLPEDTSDEKAMQVWRETYRYADMASVPTEADVVEGRKYRQELLVVLDEVAAAEGLNEYTTALSLMASTNAVNKRAFGIAVSAVTFVDRHQNRNQDPVAARFEAAKTASQFVGTLKKRTDLDLTFIECRPTGQGYSVSTFLTADNSVVTTFTHYALTRGQNVTLRCTPIRHSEFRGTKQTVVNRPEMK